MRAMVLAAGEGRRLWPVTERLPKPMVPLAGRPLLEYTIRWLRRYGIQELVINLHHRPEVIQDYFGDGSALNLCITYSYEPELLGTAGAIKAVAHLFAEETFLIVYGDNLTNCNLARLVAYHKAKGGLATIALHYREDVTQSGMVVTDDTDKVTHFQEKPPASEACSNWVNAGILVAEPALLRYIPGSGFSDLSSDVLPAALADGQKLYGYRMAEDLWWVDSLEDYRSLERLMADGAMAL